MLTIFFLSLLSTPIFSTTSTLILNYPAQISNVNPVGTYCFPPQQSSYVQVCDNHSKSSYIKESEDHYYEKKTEFQAWLTLAIESEYLCMESLPEWINKLAVDNIVEDIKLLQDAKTKKFAFIIAIAGQFRYELAKLQKTEKYSDFGSDVRFFRKTHEERTQNTTLLLDALECSNDKELDEDAGVLTKNINNFFNSKILIVPNSFLTWYCPETAESIVEKAKKEIPEYKNYKIHGYNKTISLQSYGILQASEAVEGALLQVGHLFVSAGNDKSCFVNCFVPSDENVLSQLWESFAMCFYNSLEESYDQESRIQEIAKFYWLFIHLAPYKRGSTECAEWITEFLLEKLNIEQSYIILCDGMQAIYYELNDFVNFFSEKALEDNTDD